MATTIAHPRRPSFSPLAPWLVNPDQIDNLQNLVLWPDAAHTWWRRHNRYAAPRRPWK